MKQAFYQGMPYTDWALAAMLICGLLFFCALARVLWRRSAAWQAEAALPLQDDAAPLSTQPSETP
ncbi:MAG: hypothetical protein K1X64_10225 [Myxococcaceae bacterium]|nr:hypothetical protein [Myxococcaceae bacterium]